MGISQAMSEQMKYYNRLLVNNNFLDYKIPTSLDTPEIHTNIIETNDPEGPFEERVWRRRYSSCNSAIANTIFNAVGIRVITTNKC